MKRLSLSLFLALTMLASATSASIRLPAAGDAVSGAAEVDSELQAVFSPPKAQNGVVDVPHTGGASLNLADVLTVERRASLWWDYARDVASVVSLSVGGDGQRRCNPGLFRCCTHVSCPPSRLLAQLLTPRHPA